MSNLINDLLDHAKLEEQVFTLNEEYINLIDVVQEAFQILTFQAQAKNISLYLIVDQSKPYILQKVHSDRRRLLQIFLNFLSNSLKFTRPNGYIKMQLIVQEEQSSSSDDHHDSKDNLDFRVNSSKSMIVQKKNIMSSIIMKQEKNVKKYIKLQIRIEDNGVGISEENLGKLFTDYTKLDEHSIINAKGTGLGLSICKNIIQKMGGDVDVQSTVGVGTSFIITLQLKANDKVL